MFVQMLLPIWSPPMHDLISRIIVHGKRYNPLSGNRLGGSHPVCLSSASASTPRSHDNPRGSAFSRRLRRWLRRDRQFTNDLNTIPCPVEIFFKNTPNGRLCRLVVNVI